MYQLNRLFNLRPVNSEENEKQHFIVEFPRTGPKFVLQKLQKLENFPYQPCSYPEYLRSFQSKTHSDHIQNAEALDEIEDEELSGDEESTEFNHTATNTGKRCVIVRVLQIDHS